MEHILELVVSKLLEHGPWGLLVGLLGYLNWRQGQNLEKAVQALFDLHDKRATESGKNVEALTTAAAASIKLSDAIKTMSDKVEEAGDTVAHKLDGCTNVIQVQGEKFVELRTIIASDIQNRGRARRG
jgi:hypothetical protein